MLRKPEIKFSLKLLLIQLFLFVSFSCKTTSALLQDKYTDPEVLPVETLCPEEIIWKDIDNKSLPEGTVQLTEFKVSQINAKWMCVKINLDTPGIALSAEPHSNKLGKRFYLKDFSQKNKTVTAINTVPFDLKGKTYIPTSVVKIENEIIVPVNSRYSALGLIPVQTGSAKTYRAVIIPIQNEEEILECEYAFGGFYTILKDDQIYQFARNKRSRTAAGISNDGKFLYLFAGCGINCPTGRNGFNFEECALILQKLGCTSAMEFDGGHSTGLTINNQNALKPALQRKVPAALGIKFCK